MDFSLSPEQAMLRDSVERFAAEHGDFPAWRRRVAAGEAFDASAWAQMAQLGWLGIAVPEAAGGMGFGPVETMLVAEGLGRSLCRVPYAGSCVLAPALLAESDPLLGDIVAGTVQVAAAVSEAEGRYDLAHVATRAVRSGGGWVLDGAKSFVPDGATADWFIVPARTAGGVADTAGVTLFLVPATAQGLQVQRHRGPDHHHHAKLVLRQVEAAVLGGVSVGVGSVAALVILSFLLTMDTVALAMGVVGAGVVRMIGSLMVGLLVYFATAPEGKTFWGAFLAANLLALVVESMWGIVNNKSGVAGASSVTVGATE